MLQPMDVLLWPRPTLRRLSWRRPLRMLRKIPLWVEGLFVSRLSGGSSEYYHCGLLDWGAITGRPRWWAFSTRLLTGLIPIPLEREVRRAGPTGIDVFRYSGTLSAEQIHKMRERQDELVGTPYALRDCYRLALRNLPIVRLCFGIPTDDEAKVSNVFCAAHDSTVWNAAGLDLVKRRSCSWTSPSDISHSAILDYQFTLIS